LVALSVAKVLNPNGKVIKARSYDDLDRMLKEAVEEFV